MKKQCYKQVRISHSLGGVGVSPSAFLQEILKEVLVLYDQLIPFTRCLMAPVFIRQYSKAVSL